MEQLLQFFPKNKTKKNKQQSRAPRTFTSQLFCLKNLPMVKIHKNSKYQKDVQRRSFKSGDTGEVLSKKERFSDSPVYYVTATGPKPQLA